MATLWCPNREGRPGQAVQWRGSGGWSRTAGVDWPAIVLETAFEGERLGRWVRAQRAGWAERGAEQRDLLAALGVEEERELAAARAAAVAKPKASRADRFQQHLAALVVFVERERHAKVPRAHKTGEGLSLGTWLNNTRARQGQAQQ